MASRDANLSSLAHCFGKWAIGKGDDVVGFETEVGTLKLDQNRVCGVII